MRDIEDILKEMTLEEKAVLCSGKDTWRLKSIERLGVNEIAVSDGPHGLRKQDAESDHLGLNESVKSVCFPAACATAASFDIKLLEELGSTLGEECQAENVSVLLGPAMNIKRSPLCGRNFEYFSEDPYLTGRLAAAQINGIQKHGVGACPKHFAANNQEYMRMTNSSEIDEKTFREIYLSGFEYAVKNANPYTMMCSYNKINGVFASENKWLLTDILRNEWGFNGLVMSDWGAVNNRVSALCAGLDLEMPYSGGENDVAIVKAVKDGIIDEKTVDTAAKRVLNLISKCSEEKSEPFSYDRKNHHNKAVKMATECAVLLKNNGVLPLKRENNITYIGKFAKAPRYQGGGSSHINSYSISDALSSAKNRDKITYIDAFSEDSNDINIDEIVKVAEKSETAVVFVGLSDLTESEGYDRENMKLPDCQNKLIERLAKINENTVVVLHTGSPVEMPWIDSVSAVLCMYLVGEGVGEAADALLYGDANPCGRLPETFPLCLEDTPTYLTYGTDEHRAVYSEGEFVGYRYYNAKNMYVLFPFGFGLSYTEFAYSNFKLSDSEISAENSLTAEISVTNIGKTAGKEVVQFYAKNLAKKISVPVLCGFDKIYLKPKESKTVSVQIDYRTFQEYSTEIGDWLCSGGEFEIYAAKNSREFCCSATVYAKADKEVPFTVDENTTVSALLSHPSTAEKMKSLLARFRTAVGAEKQDAQAQKIMREMVLSVPLRGLANLRLMTNEQIKSLITFMNDN